MHIACQHVRVPFPMLARLLEPLSPLCLTPLPLVSSWSGGDEASTPASSASNHSSASRKHVHMHSQACAQAQLKMRVCGKQQECVAALLLQAATHPCCSPSLPLSNPLSPPTDTIVNENNVYWDKSHDTDKRRREQGTSHPKHTHTRRPPMACQLQTDCGVLT